MILYAIRNKKTGHFIPEPKSVGVSGYTHAECNGRGIPRLFEQEITAKLALTQWLRGKHNQYLTDSDSEYDWHMCVCGTTVDLEPNRIKEDMEVVQVSLNINEEKL